MADIVQEQRQPTLIQFPTDLDFDELRDVDAVNAYQADDDGLRQIGGLTELVELTAYGGTYTDGGVAALGNLTKLESVSLHGNGLTSVGFAAMATAWPVLRCLGVGLGPTTTRDVAGITAAFPNLVSLSISSPSMSIDHLDAIQPLDRLENLSVWGGGDFLGGDDQSADPLTGLALLERFPAIQHLSATWSNGASMISDHTVVAMLKRRPGMTINQTWYDPSVFADGRPPGEVPGDGSLVELTDANFDEVLHSTPVALVVFCTTAPNICKRNTFAGEVVGQKLADMAPTLKGRVTVGRVDLHEQPALAERFDVFGAPDLWVFRHGEHVGRLGVYRSGSIVTQLAPLLRS